MAKFLFPIPQWFLSSGAVNAGGLIQTLMAGTATPLATWSESTGTSLNANPVVLDSAGRAQIWLSAAAYKFVVQTSAGVTIMTIDGYNPDLLASTVTSLTSTGDVTLQQATAATSGANQSSGNVKIQATYWDGAASQVDQWNLQDVLGTGSNPTTTLTVTHSGSSGTSAVNFPSQPVRVGDGTAAGPGYAFVSEVNTGWFRQAAGVIGAAIAGTCRWLMRATGALFGSGGVVAWSSNADPSAAVADFGISRLGAASGGVGNGTAADVSGALTLTNLIGPSSVPIHVRPGAAATQALLIDSSAGAGTNLFNFTNAGNLQLTAAGGLIQFNGSGSGSTNLQASATASGTLTLPAETGTLGIKPTVTLKKGTGAGNYNGTNTNFADVDATNLALTVTIPTGWKLSVRVDAAVFNSTATANTALAIFDGSVLVENQISGVLNVTAASTLSWVINGDGNSHTIKLQAKTTAGADAWNIFNDTATRVPTMIFMLMPSN